MNYLSLNTLQEIMPDRSISDSKDKIFSPNLSKNSNLLKEMNSEVVLESNLKEKKEWMQVVLPENGSKFFLKKFSMKIMPYSLFLPVEILTNLIKMVLKYTADCILYNISTL